MVAGDDIQRMGDAVQDALDIAQLLIAALVGEVTSHHHGINIGSVDFGHRRTQLPLVGITRGHMHVTQDGQPDHPTLHGEHGHRHCQP